MTDSRTASSFARLLKAINKREARVAVLGQGYIGFPLSLLLAKAGFRVVGYDINSQLVQRLKAGLTPFSGETGLDDLLMAAKRSGEYSPTSNASEIRGSDVYVIAVPTPRINGGEPDLSYLRSALELVKASVDRDCLVVVESTVPPGTTAGLVARELAKLSWAKIFVAHCPERAMPGKLIEELTHAHRVIGGVDEESGRLAQELYASFSEGKITVTDALTAEVVKLVENTYRDVNIALANEIARICSALGVSARRVIEIANMHPRVAILRPGIGVGGSCLTKDPLFLANASMERGYVPELILRARGINESMPELAAREILDFIESTERSRSQAVVAVLGTAYKGGVSDARGSPAGQLIRLLLSGGVEVRAYDPRCRESFGAEMTNDPYEAAKGACCVVLATDHPEFYELNLTSLRKYCAQDGPVLLYDGRLVFRREIVEKAGFVYSGIGEPSLRPSALIGARVGTRQRA